MLPTWRTAIAAGLIAGASPSPLAQAPTFSAKREVVRVDALVSADGKAVRGLAQGDFELYDNGVRQTIDFVGFEQGGLNVVLALDVSASLTPKQLGDLRAACKTVVEALTKDDRSAVVTFSEMVSLASPLTSDATNAAAALSAVEASGTTSLMDGVYAAVTVADAPQGRGLVIVFSDGSDTASWLTKAQVSDAARRSNVVIYGVASGRTPAAFLGDMADATGGHSYQIESTADIRNTFLKILAEFRERYVLGYSPQGVTSGGWHRLDVRVKGRRVAVRARPGYLAK